MINFVPIKWFFLLFKIEKVIEMKLRYLLFAFGLILPIPGFAQASPLVPDTKSVEANKKTCNCQEDKRHHHMMHKHWQEEMAERQQKILSWVNQYTPDKKAEWTKVIKEKETLKTQWMSPENASKRDKWKEQKMAQMKELRQQLESGKITKEEFMKKVHGDKVLGHWKTYHDLEVAVEAKNDQHAAELLNQLLKQYKQHNQMMKDMLKQ
jgi:hypothetical protein